MTRVDLTTVDLTAYVNATSDPMIVVARDGRLVAANLPARETLGMHVGSQLGSYCKSCSDAALLSTEFRGSTAECLRKLQLANGQSVMITGRRLGKTLRDGNFVSLRFDAHTQLSTAFTSLTLRLKENRRRLHALEEERRQLKAENEMLSHQALHDKLTGLYNRSGLEEKLEALEQSSTAARPVPFAILYLDMDRLKEVNDAYGHAAGDQLIQRFGRILTRSIRGTDIAARLGGDEFAIILRGAATATNVQHVSDRITAQLRVPYNLVPDGEDAAKPIVQSVSIGAALWPSIDASPQELLQYADRAMYRVKARGGGLCFHEPEPPVPLRLAN